jgi:hypothetical protein
MTLESLGRGGKSEFVCREYGADGELTSQLTLR